MVTRRSAAAALATSMSGTLRSTWAVARSVAAYRGPQIGAEGVPGVRGRDRAGIALSGRMTAAGMLLQLDGSRHDLVEARGPLVDARGRHRRRHRDRDRPCPP